jgi:hypothetical protein
VKRFLALSVLLASFAGVTATAPAQAKLVSKPACVQRTMPAHLHLQVGYCK